MKISNVSLLVAVMIGVGAHSDASAGDCLEHAGARYLNAGEFDSAYRSLKACENTAKVSSTTLVNLAMLYGSQDYGDLPEDEALIKVWELLHRAAILGNRDAISSVAQLYADGEPKIGIRPSPEKEACIRRLAASGRGAVKLQECFAD